MAERICTIPGCDRDIEYTTRGLCRKCYKRVTAVVVRPTLPDVQRFEKRITAGDDGCWVWTGHINRPGGYGRLAISGRRTVYAHRWSYEYHRAPIPTGLEIDHLCRNTLCVNPWHLEPVTAAENMRRAAAVITHCVHGHEYTEGNTYHRPDAPQRRGCLTCRRASARKPTAA